MEKWTDKEHKSQEIILAMLEGQLGCSQKRYILLSFVALLYKSYFKDGNTTTGMEKGFRHMRNLIVSDG